MGTHEVTPYSSGISGGDPLAIADDSQLMQLAAHRARDLFPVLERAQSLTPLLILLAFLPSLSVLTQYKFDENGALWGLKSLDALDAHTIHEFVDPGKSGPTLTLKAQPPLGSWLTAVVMSAVGTSSPFALMFVPYLSTGALVIMSYFLLQRLYGARVGFLTALMLAFHGPFLKLAQTPAPYSLSILMAVIAFWGMAGHLKESRGVVSFPLLICGVALGLCFLSGGPLAIVTTAIMFGYALSFHKMTLNGKSDRPTKRRRIWSDWIAIRSLFIVLLTTFAVGGWWFLMMWSRQGITFLDDWTAGTLFGITFQSHPERPGMPSSLVGLTLHKLISHLGLFVGFSLLGFYRACREAFPKTSTNENRQHGSRFLIVWTSIAFLLLLGVQSQSIAISSNPALAYAFFLIPSISLAAFGIDEIARRRVDVRIVAAVFFLTVAAIGGKHLILQIENGNIQFVAWALLVLTAVATLIVWQVGLICDENDSRQRLVIGSTIMVLIAFDILAGLSAFHARNPENHVLSELRNRLIEDSENKPTSTTLIIRDTFPLRLQFLLRSVLPDAKVKRVSDWDSAILKSNFDQSAPSDSPLILDWKPRETRDSTSFIPGWELKELNLSRKADHRQLRAYLVTKSPEDLQQ